MLTARNPSHRSDRYNSCLFPFIVSRCIRTVPRGQFPWCVVVSLCLVASTVGASAQSAEYAVKAAYLFHFVNYIEWPADAFEGPSAPLRLCIAGADPFGRELDDVVRDEVVDGHPLEVRRVTVSDDVRTCHVLFVSASVARPDSVLRKVANAPVLTVGESAAFWRAGGMLRFVRDGNNVRFDANAQAALTAGLRLSARLMQVARVTT